MPSETMDLQSLSSPSIFSDDMNFPTERQVGFWKLDPVLDQRECMKPVTPSTVEKIIPVESHITRYMDNAEPFTKQHPKVNPCVNSLTVGADRVLNQSLKSSKPICRDNGFHSAKGNKVNTMTSLFENSLFSNSFSEFFTRKLNLSSENAIYGNSIDTISSSHYEEEEPFESLEELEAQTIGNLLPDDDDLFSGVTNGLDFVFQPYGAEYTEESDVFSSVGGMDLGDDGPTVVRKNEKSHLGLFNGSAGEHPSRTLLVRNINIDVEESELKAIFEQYGEIHSLDTACKHLGFVMISYYDIRAAQKAMDALQDRPLRCRKLDICYSIPKDENQGSIVVFNLNSTVSNDKNRRIFGAHGEIEEINQTPKNHKFIEFYNVRAAEAALHVLNKSEIAGNQVEVELSHPESSRRCSAQPLPSAQQDEWYRYEHPHSPPTDANLAVGPNSSNNMDVGTSSGLNSAIKAPFSESTIPYGISPIVSNGLTSMGSTGHQSVMAESGHLQMKLDVQDAPAFNPRPLPEYQNGLSRAVHSNSSGPWAGNINSKPLEIIDNKPLSRIGSTENLFEFSNAGFRSAGNGSHLLPGHSYSWSNSYQPEPPSMTWPNSPPLVNGIYAAHPKAQLDGLPTTHSLNTGVPIINYHVGSAPTVNPSLWDWRHAYGDESANTCFHPGSLGSMRGLQMFHSRSSVYNRRGQSIPIMRAVDSSHDHVRSRRNEGSMNQADKKQYELDIERIIQGEDKRTTLMLKNIPNKYTSNMLLAAINERGGGTYDFVYLPIDFKNKCNVGYAFVNMIEPSQVIAFYQAFNGKKWEKFNSEKVASLAYARIQGKAALIAHFQNSSLMNEDKRCRPILFNTDGPNAGDQVPFPVAANVRTRLGRARSDESPSSSENEETCSPKGSD
ncbi:protein MEI2-like 4 [Hibiscus syriacus]|uniref:protein MEI2-like 4 n=1 Tax=Hibiscus syriacus TaxID=106335 RepID=UPI001924A38F|nr:protein MEI2-like 4 [Hibiscus syriacus]